MLAFIILIDAWGLDELFMIEIKGLANFSVPSNSTVGNQKICSASGNQEDNVVIDYEHINDVPLNSTVTVVFTTDVSNKKWGIR